MQVTKTRLNDVLIFEPKVFGDERGFFMETFRSDFLLNKPMLNNLCRIITVNQHKAFSEGCIIS
jgi:dTDP-4-dehydrorhamnose 3,5-epimerase-like enzyme